MRCLWLRRIICSSSPCSLWPAKGSQLIGETFSSLTKTRLKSFSAGAWTASFGANKVGHWVLTTLDKGAKERLCAADREVLDALLKVHGYPLSSAEKGEKHLGLLQTVGGLSGKDNEYGLIVRIFSDQYTVSVSAISASQDFYYATFRRKGVQKVKGYSVNLTEPVMRRASI